MVTALACGSCIIALGPSCALVFMVAFHRSHTALVSFAAAFAWLAGCAASSLVQCLLPAALGSAVLLLVGVAGQETMRALFVKGCIRLENALAIAAGHKNSDHLPLNDAAIAIAGGAGWALMHGLVTFGTVFSTDEGGGLAGSSAGFTYVDSCRRLPLILLTAITAAMVAVMDVALMCLAFAASRHIHQQVSPAVDAAALAAGSRPATGSLGAPTSRGKGLWLAILCSHALAALVTMLHLPSGTSFGGCRLSLPCLAVIVGASCALAARNMPSTQSGYERHKS